MRPFNIKVIKSGLILLGIILSACGGGSTGALVTPSANITVASAPSLVSLIGADAGLVAAFIAPVSNGGAAISGYTLQCVTGGTINRVTAASSPISISGLSNGASYSCTLTASNSAGVSPPSNALSAAPVAVSATIDPSHLPLGDGKLSTTTAQRNFVYTCTIPSSANPPGKAPWINSDGVSWDSTAKVNVAGTVNWVSVFAANTMNGQLSVSGNGLPNHATGSFPVSASDPAYQYDKNPNAIQSVAIAWGLPANPQVAANPSCTSLGAIGVLLTGARIFNALDADGRDAVAHEVQDRCAGHPQSIGSYHYHSVSSCVAQKDSVGTHSPLVGYIADGFGIYGNLGEAGKPLSNADLDECHGHSHMLMINGAAVVQYHYHATKEYPYTIGCYRGTPVAVH